MFMEESDPNFDLTEAREQAVDNIVKNAIYDKARFDKTKAQVHKFTLGDYVLLKNEERNQTKLDPKFRGPFKIVEILDGDRYRLQGLDSKRSLRRMPEGYELPEFEIEESDPEW